MKWHRFSLLRQAIIASVVMCAVATSAKAELDIIITNVDTGATIYNGNITGLASSYTSNGYTISNITATTITSLAGVGPGTGIQVGATIVNTLGISNLNTDTFSFQLSSKNTSGVGLYNQITAIGSVQSLYSQSAVGASTYSGGTVTTYSSYTGYLSGSANDPEGPVESGTPSSAAGTNTKSFSFNNASTTFDLAAVTAEANLTGGQGSSTNFTGAAFLALPEPNGVVAFMAGVPFLFGALRMVRRRSPMTVENAIA